MKKSLVIIILLIVLAVIFTACAPAENSVENDQSEDQTGEDIADEDDVNEAESEDAEGAVEDSETEEENLPEESKVGGNFVWSVNSEPDSLDPHKTNKAVSDGIMSLLGTSLVALSPDGDFIPYAAKSWTTSEDGLVWEFIIREDIKFHNGDPLTAHDFAWTYQRAVDPETASPAAGSMLGAMVSAEAVDDYTLRITLAQPFFPFLFSLASSGYLQPLSQNAIMEIGEDAYGHSPVGTGPYILKEWLTGEHVILERNPEYTWGPDFGGNTEAYFVETIEFRIIPEYATSMAGMESGEIDFMIVETKDMGFFRENSDFTVYERPFQGISPYIAINLEEEPFTDINVRKAMNLALDRMVMIDIVLNGQGEIQYGPMSEGMIGYWPGVEEIGYQYDVEQAASYMEAAGYSKNVDGIWEKDGEKISFEIPVNLTNETNVRIAQLLQEQYKNFGFEIEIKSVEPGVYSDQIMRGDYFAALVGWEYPEADLLYHIFHSSMIDGGLNIHRVNDPELDTMLEQSRTEMDPQSRQEIVNSIQKWVVENAVVIPIYTPTQNYVVRNSIENLVFSEQFGLYFYDAYMK